MAFIEDPKTGSPSPRGGRRTEIYRLTGSVRQFGQHSDFLQLYLESVQGKGVVAGNPPCAELPSAPSRERLAATGKRRSPEHLRRESRKKPLTFAFISRFASIPRLGRPVPLSIRRALRNGLARAIVALLCAGVVGPVGCATAPQSEDPESREAFERANDPLEPFNRAVFAVTSRPTVSFSSRSLTSTRSRSRSDPGHGEQFPAQFAQPRDPVERSVAGRCRPRGDDHAAVHGEQHAGIRRHRGSGGEFGFVRRDEDFGQTLAVWGVGEGPYLMLPLLGPSNAAGRGRSDGDYFSDR